MGEIISYFPWVPIKSEEAEKTSLELWMIKLVFSYQKELKNMVLKYLGRNVFLEEYNLSEGIKTIPYKQLFNAIENNLRMLIATDVMFEMEPMRVWHGGLRDERWLNYADVNRWFATMNYLINYINVISSRYLETGAFYCGVNPDHQILGIG